MPTFIMQWMHSHSEVPRNELADNATKEAIQLNSGTPNTSPINFEVATSIIKRTKSVYPPVHPLIDETYSKQEQKRDQTAKKQEIWLTI